MCADGHGKEELTEVVGRQTEGAVDEGIVDKAVAGLCPILDPYRPQQARYSRGQDGGENHCRQHRDMVSGAGEQGSRGAGE